MRCGNVGDYSLGGRMTVMICVRVVLVLLLLSAATS